MEAEVHMLNGQQSADQENDRLLSTGQGDAVSKSNTIKLGLEKNISDASKQKIYDILDKVNKLSDVEKLLLYLKLPTGVTTSPSATGTETGFQREEHQKALRWLRTHLEEDSRTCVQKQELFDQYRSFCEQHHYKCVNQFDFGKLLRHLFPKLKLRHLGQRGQSKTCYGGLKNCDQLKPLTVPKLNIVDDDHDKVLTDRLGEDGSITQAACELVCEWAQKLHDNKHFSSVQALAEHLISSCVVSTHSTAAFTIIAAAQRHDRNIISDNPGSGQSNAGSGTDLSANRSALQPKTQLQLQRTLKGRKMLREQKEKMEFQNAAMVKSATSVQSNTGSTASRQDVRSHTSTKKSSLVQTQKNILPKCAPTAEVRHTSRTNQQQVQVASEDSHIVMSALTASSTMSPVTSGGHLFMLSSQMSNSQMKQPAPEVGQLIQPAQMVILSPLKHTSSQCMAVSKEKHPVVRMQSPTVRNAAPNTSVASTTYRSNSTLAMLLTEKLDDGERDNKMAGSKNVPKLFRSSSIDLVSGQCTPTSSSQPSQGNRSTGIVSSTDQDNSSSITTATSKSFTMRKASSQEHGSQPAVANAGKGGKGKKRLTPLKNKQSSKTVSTLLKETRGYGPAIDLKGFVNDRRPVSQLLKECRQRNTSGEESSPSSCIVITPAPVSCNPACTHPVNLTLAAPVVVTSQQATPGSAQTHGTSVSLQPQPADVIVLKPTLGGSTGCEGGALKSMATSQNSTPTSQEALFQFSGSTQMPFAKQTLNLSQGSIPSSQLIAIDGTISTSALHCFGKLVPFSGAFVEQVGHQDGNNNEGLSDNKPELYDVMPSQVSQNTINSSNVKDEVNVSNIENDALNEYLANELASDLADITPSLTIDGQVATEDEQLGSGTSMSAVESQLADSDPSSFRPQNFPNQAFMMQNDDPFMCYEEAQRKMSSGMQTAVEGRRDEDLHYGQRPASEQMIQNPGICSMPVSNTSTRPSTMPPELDVTYSSSLQKYLVQTQPSVSIGDHNSTDSFSGYTTPGRMTPASQMAMTRSPSLCSAPSTPSSLLSPPDRFGSTEPTNSFMPIQGNMASLQPDQVSPIRPMVRNMASAEGQTSCKYLNSRTNGKDLPTFSNPAAPVNFGGSFVPYSTASGEQTTGSFMSTTEDSQQAQENVNLQQDHFLPVSFIRPVKRPMVTSQQHGGQKRVRHRSAQDAKSLYKAQAKNKTNKYNMLTTLLRLGSNQCQPSIQALCETALQKGQTLQRPSALPKLLPADDISNNNSNPQSPFSPEVENIMGGDDQSGVECVDMLGLGVFRSHSVPAQSLQRAGSDTPDLVSQLNTDQPQNQDMQKLNANLDISSLLQDQIPDEQAGHGLDFAARRNINHLLQDDGSCLDNFYSPSLRGDHMISGASVRTSQQQVNAMTSHLLAAHRARKLASYSSGGVGTPPPSQNPTPDFSMELSTMGDNGNTFSVGRITSSTLIDTPNSLDTLATQDSQESLKENLLVGICVESEEMQPTLNQPHDVDYGTLTSNERLKLLGI